MANYKHKSVTKKTKPPQKSKRHRITRTASLKLASCVLFALKFLKGPGDTKAKGYALTIDLKTGKPGKRWPDTFMDALDSVGYEIDRAHFYKTQRRR